MKVVFMFFPLWISSPTRARAVWFLGFLDHTHWHIIIGRTPLDEWSARRKDLYLTTHNAQETDFHAHGGIRNLDRTKRAAADLRRRPFRNLDRQVVFIIIIIIIITWRYSPTWALASCAIRLHWSLFWAFLPHPSIPISRRPSRTSSSIYSRHKRREMKFELSSANVCRCQTTRKSVTFDMKHVSVWTNERMGRPTDTRPIWRYEVDAQVRFMLHSWSHSQVCQFLIHVLRFPRRLLLKWWPFWDHIPCLSVSVNWVESLWRWTQEVRP